MATLTLNFGDEKTTWTKILDFIRTNPGFIYKGTPLAILAYISFPYSLILLNWIPWIWAGYEVYHKIPPGSANALWTAIQSYKNR